MRLVVADTSPTDLILIDQRKGTPIAIAKGFTVTGTLGALRLATQAGLIDLPDVIGKLKGTNFRYRQEMLDGLLNEFSRKVL